MTAVEDPYLSVDRSVRTGTIAAAALATLVVGLSTVVSLSGAVVASGQMVVDTSVKKIQHPTGGVVGAILARDGQRVAAGETLVRLDDTQTKANLAVVTKELDELAARRSREEAERDGFDVVRFPDSLVARVNEPEVKRLLDGELTLFLNRKSARQNQKAALQEQIAGLEVQRESRVSQIEWIHRELEGVRDLWKKNLVPYSKLTALEREAVRLEGERGQLISSVAETQLKIGQIDQDLRSETGKDLAEIRAKTGELVEKKVAVEDQMKRIEIKSPLDGIIHQSQAHTVGGVVSPGETLMQVVPEHDALTVEIKVAPQDIDQVHLGQPAIVKFPGFNQRTTPELNGDVSLVSADVAQDQKTGATYYVARIAVPARELDRLDGQKLVPGMPVETFVQTGKRTVMSYLTKPLRDQIARAFREK
jgi:HlyD family secretion protein